MNISSNHFIPFGFQYYRSPTPHRLEWERDLANIAAQGFNTVKYWVQWRASHVGPDQFEFDDIQELMDLASKYDLRVILNVIFDAAPAWFYKQFPKSKMITANGQILEPTAISSRQLGGAPGPCYHHAESITHKEVFLKAAVAKFKEHPALYIWDLWNEPELTTSLKRELSFDNQVCYCDLSLESFYKWLENKYAHITSLNEKWQRNYKQWDEVEAPRTQALFNDMVDWRLFFVETLTEELKRRIATVKSLDTRHEVMCHTVPSPIFNVITAGSDDFMLSEPCDLFGNSLGSSAWAADLLKSAAKGKKLINSEIHALPGTTALKPQKPDLIAIKNHILIPLAREITGFVFWQYRPETLGLESPAWGHTYLNGKATPWLEETAQLNRTIQLNQDIILGSKRKSDGIAILYSIKSQIANFSMFGHLKTFEDSMQGAHQLLHDLNYKVEFIHEKDLANELKQYRCLWMPFPIFLDQLTCDVLREWIAEGGILISECSFGMLQSENGMHSIDIPGYQFDEVFGLREIWCHSTENLDHSYHHKTLDKGNSFIEIEWKSQAQDLGNSLKLSGTYYQSEIELSPETEVIASFSSDQGAAITSHNYGKGKAIWIGTLLGAAYWVKPDIQTRQCFSELLNELGIVPVFETDQEGIRLDYLEQPEHSLGAETILFAQNLTDHDISCRIVRKGFQTDKMVPWFSDGDLVNERTSFKLKLKAKDIQVFRCTFVVAD